MTTPLRTCPAGLDRDSAHDVLAVDRALDDLDARDRFRAHVRDLAADLEARSRNLAQAAAPSVTDDLRGDGPRLVRAVRRLLLDEVLAALMRGGTLAWVIALALMAGACTLWLPTTRDPAPSKPCRAIDGTEWPDPSGCRMWSRYVLERAAEKARRADP